MLELLSQFSISLLIDSQVLFDTLILTGTNPAFLIIRDYITKGYFTVEQAAQAISTFPATIETPTKEFFITFFVSINCSKQATCLKCKLTVKKFIGFHQV